MGYFLPVLALAIDRDRSAKREILAFCPAPACGESARIGMADKREAMDTRISGFKRAV
jgi:hypothetical protein